MFYSHRSQFNASPAAVARVGTVGRIRLESNSCLSISRDVMAKKNVYAREPPAVHAEPFTLQTADTWLQSISSETLGHYVRVSNLSISSLFAFGTTH